MRYLIIMFMLVASATTATATEINKERFINAIIGEAEGGGLEGMRCVASAIRNRGTLKGVYGENSKRVKNRLYSSRTFVLAVQAYEESRLKDYSFGADHWEGVSFKTPYWAKDMVVTTVCGGNRFYKEK